MNGLTDIDGILVGHATDLDAWTGCTAILCPEGAVAGLDQRGSATASLQTDLLNPLHLNDRMHAVVLTGGSAYGLEAAFGVMRYLREKKIGFPTSAGVVPLVPAAALYDLGVGKPVSPGREMGEAAARAASSATVGEGNVGAGTGASVGKVFGLSHAMKAGIGSATVWLDGPYAGVRVAALAAVNAVGDIVDPDTGRVIAGARHSPNSTDLVDSAEQIKRGARGGFQKENTTLVVVATNARLTKMQANKLAQLASTGMARAIRPVWTTSDGDTLFTLSHGGAQADLTALGVAAGEAVAEAIVRAATQAKSAAGLPGLG